MALFKLVTGTWKHLIRLLGVRIHGSVCDAASCGVLRTRDIASNSDGSEAARGRTTVSDK